MVGGLLLAVSLLSGPRGPGPLAIAADHHVHILGPGLVRDWKSLGVAFSRPDAAYLSPAAVLDGVDAVGQALLVPMAHLYGNAELREGLRLSEADEYARVSAENDYVAAQAARWPGRAVALCAVDWRRPYAWEELDRCRQKLKSPGIKLHLASAGTDLRDAAQRAELGRIAGWADQHGLAMLLHLDPQRRGHVVADIDRFLAEVLGPHPRLEVTVAHLGGSGGYGTWTQSVFRAFISWLDRERAAGRERSGVRVDVSAALLEKESEGVPPTTPEEARALGDDLRRLGLGRVLFASDYPVFAPRRLAELFAERTGLAPVELAQLLSNRAPVLASRPPMR
jgi:predicted TIM-barrel fold metal-dependent hydrolase